MSRYKKADNVFCDLIIDGKDAVEFITKGKYQHRVIVDREPWYNYLKDYSWTALHSSNGKRITVKSSDKNLSQAIWRVIVEHEYDEIDYWGSTIDHINNNPLDNRLSNLRLFNTAILNTTNITSKYIENDMQYIHKQGRASSPNGYKVHYNIAGIAFYQNFGAKEYGSLEKALEAAKQYRNNVVYTQRSIIIDNMIKKARDIEFERGLRDKIRAGETDEIISILKKYGVNS